MEKRIKVGYSESSKAVTAHVEIEYIIDNVDEELKIEMNDQADKEAKLLFDKAMSYSNLQTLKKNR